MESKSGNFPDPMMSRDRNSRPAMVSLSVVVLMVMSLALASADEVHDLEAVARGQLGRGPVGLADDSAVELDRDALARHVALVEQAAHRRPPGGRAGPPADRDVARVCHR